MRRCRVFVLPVDTFPMRGHQDGHMFEEPTTTADLLSFWREATRAAELAERLAGVAAESAERAEMSASASEEIADLAEQAAARGKSGGAHP
jgi:hypothetical protein